MFNVLRSAFFAITLPTLSAFLNTKSAHKKTGLPRGVRKGRLKINLPG